MKLFVITFVVVFQLQSGWTQEEAVIVAEKVEQDVTEKESKPVSPSGTGAKLAHAKPADQGEKSREIDDLSLPSLNLFPLLDPSATSKLPPLPVGAHTPPAKKLVNGRWVITRVPKPAVSKKPQMEMRKIKGKWVICLKD